jgi:hypothetical protein
VVEWLIKDKFKKFRMESFVVISRDFPGGIEETQENIN